MILILIFGSAFGKICADPFIAFPFGMIQCFFLILMIHKYTPV